MGMLVVLVPADSGETTFTPRLLRRLSELGVTQVSLVRDDATVGVVLEGWTFDPARSAPEAADILAGGRCARTLFPVMQAAVVPQTEKGVKS